jgi:hypothetical protein
MNTLKAYEEVVNFIAAGTNPRKKIAFRPSEDVRDRVADLIERERDDDLTVAERSELDHYLQLEHLMRLAKAKAHDYLETEDEVF